MSVALSIMARLNHNVRLTVSPSYRRIRGRLEAIGEPGR